MSTADLPEDSDFENSPLADPVSQALEAIRRAGGKTSGNIPRQKSTRPRSLGALRKSRRIPTRLDGRADRSYRDPGTFSELLNREIRHQGWEENVGVRRLMEDWASLTGEAIAAHTQPVKFDDKKKFLHVQSDSTAWATQLRYMQDKILQKIAAELGPDVVVELKIHNPNYGPKQTGRLRVQGRGKRDDYG